MIEYTLFAVSGDETRVNLNGIHVEATPEGRLRMVATDGHRLAMITRTVDHVTLPTPITVPRKAVMELRKVLESGEDLVELSVQGGVAHAHRGRVQMSMRLVEGEFPDYNQVIPAKSERHATVDAASPASPPCDASRWSPASARAASSCSSTARDGAQHDQSGRRRGGRGDRDRVRRRRRSASDSTPAICIDVLTVLPSDKRIEIGLNDEVSPGVLRSVEDADYCYIVMPMRL